MDSCCTSISTIDWDSQSLYTAAILENGGPNRRTASKTSKKASGSFHDNWACAFVSNLPNNDSDWSVSKYSVKHDHHATPCTAPHRATHCTALRESRRTGAWFRSCLFMCTLLELFCIWAPSRGPCENQRTVMESVSLQANEDLPISGSGSDGATFQLVLVPVFGLTLSCTIWHLALGAFGCSCLCNQHNIKQVK